ncbi:MAG: hypothetical protein M0Z80_15890 [Treponema sp.]|nr:hypothetical protein [Treponema sp.]
MLLDDSAEVYVASPSIRLPLADALIAVRASTVEAILVHCDEQFESLGASGVPLGFPYPDEAGASPAAG